MEPQITEQNGVTGRDYVLYVINNPNDKAGVIDFDLVGVDESGFKLTQWSFWSRPVGSEYFKSVRAFIPANSKAFILTYTQYFKDKDFAHEWFVATTDGAIGGGVPFSRLRYDKFDFGVPEAVLEEGLRWVPIDPTNK